MTFTSATHFKRGILGAKFIKFCEFTEVLQTLTLKFHLDAVSYWVQIMVFIVRVFRFVVNQILNVAPSLAEQPLSREVVEPAIPSASSR